jgi:hypothetical protein
VQAVHSLLAYADLLLTADPRNWEVAHLLQEHYLSYLTWRLTANWYEGIDGRLTAGLQDWSSREERSLTFIKDILDTYENPNLPIEIVGVHPSRKIFNFRGNQADSFEQIRFLLFGALAYL